jgi:hypothetical protein
MSILDSYHGQSVALPTLHHKGSLIAPSFLRNLGMKIIEIDVDTDQFGSFSGEVKREGTQRETARRKAQLGVEVSGLNFAVASEGSIGADPEIGLLTSDIETLIFIDTINNLEIIENYRSFDITAQKTNFKEGMDLDQFLSKSDFPRHKLIVRSDSGYTHVVAKAISTKEELMNAITQARELTMDPIVIESDLRAHCSPTRAKNIEMVAERLTKKIASLCPRCSTPGWGVIQPLLGVPCRECEQESETATRAYLYGCLKCTHTAEGEKIADSIDPSRCNWCNP